MSWYNFKITNKLFSESEVHPHIEGEFSNNFSTSAFESTEIEYLDLIYGIVRSTKPKNILETGTFHGVSTLAISYALKENSSSIINSKFYSIEKDEFNYRIALDLLAKELKGENVHIIKSDTISFISNLTNQEPFDFIFFDSSRTVRIKEFYALLDKSLIRKGAFLAFHDTSKLRTESKIEDKKIQKSFLEGLDEIEQICESRIDFNLSRGLTLYKY